MPPLCTTQPFLPFDAAVAGLKSAPPLDVDVDISSDSLSKSSAMSRTAVVMMPSCAYPSKPASSYLWAPQTSQHPAADLDPIPRATKDLAVNVNFSLRTARGVSFPVWGDVRADTIPGAFTVPGPQQYNYEPRAVAAGELCDLFVGRVPFCHTRIVGAMLERVVGCEVFACSPLPNVKCPNQPATSCSITVRKCDVWAFEALHKRCIVTETGLLVVPEEHREELEQCVTFRDTMLQQCLGSARKGGQPLVIEKRTSQSRKAKRRNTAAVSAV